MNNLEQGEVIIETGIKGAEGNFNLEEEKSKAEKYIREQLWGQEELRERCLGIFNDFYDKIIGSEANTMDYHEIYNNLVEGWNNFSKEVINSNEEYNKKIINIKTNWESINGVIMKFIEAEKLKKIYIAPSRPKTLGGVFSRFVDKFKYLGHPNLANKFENASAKISELVEELKRHDGKFEKEFSEIINTLVKGFALFKVLEIRKAELNNREKMVENSNDNKLLSTELSFEESELFQVITILNGLESLKNNLFVALATLKDRQRNHELSKGVVMRLNMTNNILMSNAAVAIENANHANIVSMSNDGIKRADGLIRTNTSNVASNTEKLTNAISSPTIQPNTLKQIRSVLDTVEKNIKNLKEVKPEYVLLDTAVENNK